MAEALKDVPATDFGQPAPIQTLADKLKEQQRQGINAGDQRFLPGTPPGGPYQNTPAPPAVEAPTTTTLPVPSTIPFGPTTTTRFPPPTLPQR
jgi:hypothetical protein